MAEPIKLLLEFDDEGLGIGERVKLNSKYLFRRSARAILENDNGEIALQHLTVPGYYKLPGGGVEETDLTFSDAMRREIKEEVGCDSEAINLVGVVIECRNKENLIHESYCYRAKVVGEIGTPHLEQGEIDEGQETVWVTPERALELIKIRPTTYNGRFIIVREQAFLWEAFGRKE